MPRSNSKTENMNEKDSIGVNKTHQLYRRILSEEPRWTLVQRILKENLINLIKKFNKFKEDFLKMHK